MRDYLWLMWIRDRHFKKKKIFFNLLLLTPALVLNEKRKPSFLVFKDVGIYGGEFSMGQHRRVDVPWNLSFEALSVTWSIFGWGTGERGKLQIAFLVSERPLLPFQNP